MYIYTFVYIIYTYLFTPWFHIFPEDDAWKFFSAILSLQFLLTIKPAPTIQCIRCPTLYLKKAAKSHTGLKRKIHLEFRMSPGFYVDPSNLCSPHQFSLLSI